MNGKYGYKIISVHIGPNKDYQFITPDTMNSSIIDILSFPNQEFTEIQYKP